MRSAGGGVGTGCVACALSSLALGVLAPQAAAARISTARIRQIALVEAKRNGDVRPKGMAFASGPLGSALSVMNPEANGGSAQDASTPVDLVVMHGMFTSGGSTPRGVRAPKGHVLEVMIVAGTGSVQAIAISAEVPVALSRLGPVTPLRQ